MAGVRAVVFLDRDGVINKRMPKHCHVTAPEELEILPGVCEGISLINSKGYPVIVITNQRCIALKTLDEEGFSRISEKMIKECEKSGAFIDGIYYCPHDNGDACNCRKPKTGLFEEAGRDLEKLGITVDRSRSWMIGDEDTDIIAGRSYGVNTVKIGEEVPDLLAAAAKINGTQ